MTILALLLIYAGFIEPNWVQVTRVEVPIAGLPEQFDGFRIVQLSDFHFSRAKVNLPSFFRRVAAMTNQLQPDVVVVTGDLMSNPNGGKTQAPPFFSLLRSKHGAYVVWGNWDQGFPRTRAYLRERMGPSGVTFLENEAAPIEVGGARIWLLGVPYCIQPAGFTRFTLLDAANKGYRGEPTILLSHSASIWTEAAKEGVALVLSGHTHGGQVWLPLVTRLVWTRPPNPPIYRGFADLKGTKIYINRGIGVSNVPFRFLSRPEITEIVLKRG